MIRGKALLYAVTALSVAINIFVAGVFIGDTTNASSGVKKPPPPPRLDFNIRQVGQYLSPEGRRAARQILVQERRALRSSFEERRQIRREIQALMLADTVDQDALRGALQRQRAVSASLGSPIETVLLEVIALESLEVRQKIIASLYDRKKNNRSRPRPADGHPPPPPPPPGY